MIEVNSDVHDSPGVTTLRLTPNRSLGRYGVWILGLGLAGAVMATALLGAHRGNVFAPFFGLVESLAVLGALVLSWRAGNRSERIRLDAEVLEVEVRPGCHRMQFPSGWVKVSLHEGSGRQHLVLASHGRRVEIGAFLADPERQALLEKLNTVLRGLRAPHRRGGHIQDA